MYTFEPMRRAWIVFGALVAGACGGSVDHGSADAGSGGTGGNVGGTGGSVGGTGGIGGIGAMGGMGGMGATGGMGGMAAMGGTGGVLQECFDLDAQYKADLNQAKHCSSVSGFFQCTTKVDNALACPCPTFVNPDNAQVLSEMDALRQKFATLNCYALIACPAIGCWDPQKVNCLPNDAGDADTCQDWAG